MGPKRHELYDAAQAAQASVPPVMIDADEFALYVSQIPSLGPVLGRVVSAAGVGLASYASLQALGGIGEDFSAARTAYRLAQSVESAPERHLRGDAGGQRAMHALVRQEVRERIVSLVANSLMLPGSLLMDANLVASPLMLGGAFPGLLPWGAAAMAPAVVFMAAYGVWVAGKAAVDCTQDYRALKQLDVHSDEQPAAVAALKARTQTLGRIDAGLVLSGVAQAVGAVAMYLLGPIWLVPLLAGTLGLAYGKYQRAQVAGQWPVTPTVSRAGEADATPISCLPRAALLERLSESEQKIATLEPLTRGKNRLAGVARWLGRTDPSHDDVPSPRTVQLIDALSVRLADEHVFGAAAQAIANDRAFRTLLPQPSAEGYTLRPTDLLRLVRHDPADTLAPVEPLYDFARLERLCRVASSAFAPLLLHRERQARALLDVSILASLDAA